MGGHGGGLGGTVKGVAGWGLGGDGDVWEGDGEGGDKVGSGWLLGLLV